MTEFKREEFYDKHKSFLLSKLRKSFDLTEEEALSYYEICECDKAARELSWADFIDYYSSHGQNYKKMSLSKEYSQIYNWVKSKKLQNRC